MQFYLYYHRLYGKAPHCNMDNIDKREHKSNMGNSGFEEWADAFFAPDSGNSDCAIRRDMIFADFQNSTGNRQWTPQKFRTALQAFCAYTSDRIEELNPKQLQNGNGRIVRKIDGKTYECIYIRTVGHAVNEDY